MLDEVTSGHVSANRVMLGDVGRRLLASRFGRLLTGAVSQWACSRRGAGLVVELPNGALETRADIARQNCGRSQNRHT
jgi:hypothetical protein